MSLEQDIRAEIENIKKLKMEVGNINNHLSALEGMCREDMQKQIDAAYQRGLSDVSASDYQHGYNDGYQRGLEDAWEAARRIVTWPDRSLVNSDTFDLDPGENIFTKYSASEAIAKLKAYEENKDDSIKVGDEVTLKSDSILWKAVCIQIDGDRRHMNLMGYTGAVGYYPVDDFKKTGRHFDIEGILKEIRK